MRRIRRKLRIAAAWIALVLSGVGTVGILAAPAKDRQPEKELEKVLEANRKLIETKLEKGFRNKGKTPRSKEPRKAKRVPLERTGQKTEKKRILLRTRPWTGIR